MFQIINDVKSAPSTSIVPVKIHVSPLSNQKAHVLANYAKFANHFLIWTTGNGNSKFYSELCKIRSIRQPLL